VGALRAPSESPAAPAAAPPPAPARPVATTVVAPARVERTERPVATRGTANAPAPAAQPPASAIEAPPIAPLSTLARARDLAAPVVIDPPRSMPAVEPAVLTSTPERGDRSDEFGVRRALMSYETAYENLNVAATADVWPSVDRDRLSRAFATLKSQGLEF